MMSAATILDGISRLRVLVAGDICLDRWCRYEPAASDPSRETGIPRVAVVETEVTPGAAGTVANNLKSLGASEVAVLGVIGEDGFGFELKHALQRNEISSEHVVTTSSMPTFTYTKLINVETGEEDLPRVDFIYNRPVPAAVEEAVAGTLRRVWDRFDVILVSDQAETTVGGIITDHVRATVAELASTSPGKIVWVDSRAHAECFRNVILKCNLEESEAAVQRAGTRDLRSHVRAPLLVVTHGKLGVLVVHESGEHWVPTVPVERPVDICGAGDSFTAGAALALAVTGSAVEAARFGNLVASITIMKKGTGTASPAEVLEAERRRS
jgi:rfaE bifunctional protein kinase chain/domain